MKLDDIDTSKQINESLQQYDDCVTVLKDVESCKKVDSLLHWIKWVMSNEPSRMCGSSKAFWEKYSNISRDEHLLNITNSINNGKLIFVKDELNDKQSIITWAYYQDHFFYWFLRRYRLDYARQVYGFCSDGAWLVPMIMLLFPLLGLWMFSSGVAWLLPVAGYFMILLMMHCCGVPWLNAIQSLIPRLAATALVGFLFLLTADSVVEQVLKPPPCLLLFYSAVVVLISTGYLMLEIAHRLEHGVPQTSLMKRAGMVVVTGFSHSTLIVLLGYPLLTAIEPDFSTLLLLVSINMGIGIILNNVWEENPVTEPL